MIRAAIMTKAIANFVQLRGGWAVIAESRELTISVIFSAAPSRVVVGPVQMRPRELSTSFWSKSVRQATASENYM